MAIPGPYAPPPAPPKRSNALPIILALAAVFGFCLVVGIGGFVGYRWLATSPTDVPIVPPKVVRSYEDGWKRYELGSIGMAIDLPVEPARIDLTPDNSPVSIYDRAANYEVYDDLHTIDVYAFRQKMAGALEPLEIAEDHRMLYVADEAEGLKQELKKATIAGHPGAYGDFSYVLEGSPEHVKTAVILVGAAEYTLVVLGYGDTSTDAKKMADDTLDRMLKTIELTPESAAMMK